MNRIQKVGTAGSVLAVMALLTYLGLSGDVQWCQATGDVYTGGTIDPATPWILSDGETTIVCEAGGVLYPLRVCNAKEGCEGVVSYCNNVQYTDNGPGVCVDSYTVG